MSTVVCMCVRWGVGTKLAVQLPSRSLSLYIYVYNINIYIYNIIYIYVYIYNIYIYMYLELPHPRMLRHLTWGFNHTKPDRAGISRGL